MDSNECSSRRIEWLQLAVALLLGLTSLAEAEAPVPPADERSRQRSVIEELYADQLGKANTADAKQDLAGQLIRDVEDTEAGTPDQYALLEMALELATEAPAPETALRVIDTMDRSFRIDAPTRWIDALRRCLKQTQRRNDLSDLASVTLRRARRAIDHDAYEAAHRLTFIASAAARQAGASSLIHRATRLRGRIQRLKRAYQDTRPARRILEGDPDNAPANLHVGRFLCFYKGNWAVGLQHLAKGNDAELAALARRELSKPEEAAKRAALADDWWALAEGRDPIPAEHIRRHAGQWYGRAINELSGLAKARARRRLAETASGSAAERYNAFLWRPGQEPVRLIHRDRGFAFLKQVCGHLNGPEEKFGIRLTSSGQWLMEGQKKQGLWLRAFSAAPDRWSELEIQKHIWERGDQPVKMLRENEGFCVLAGLGGRFRGGGEAVRVHVANDGYWYLTGQAAQPGVHAWAYSISTDGRTLTGDGARTYKWKPGKKPVRMIHSDHGFCFLSSIRGKFAGRGESVRVYIGDDGYWYLHGHSKQVSIRAEAIAIPY